MSLNSQLMNGAAAGALKPAPRRVWRAKLKSEELTAAGFDPSDHDGAWETIKGILRLKGVPETYLQDGKNVKTKLHPWGLTLEFE